MCYYINTIHQVELDINGLMGMPLPPNVVHLVTNLYASNALEIYFENEGSY